MPIGRSPPKRKPHTSIVPYKPREPKSKVKDAPKTSAKPITSNKRDNLTLSDWVTVISYAEKHRGMSQAKIVEHFRTRQEGALEFTQSTLSRNLKNKAALLARVDENPNALSSKRPRIVTRPDVDRALFKWFQLMEGKGETVTGPMLLAKRSKFEVAFDIPKAERLSGEGWLKSFTKAYKIKEFRRHGEAGSVDFTTVAAERIRVSAILSKFQPKDRFNFDETSFFAL